jgi:tetratricopeptide (TPR) repeat protein
MNTKQDLTKKNDTLLLLLVAGLVVSGAVAIVLFSSLSVHRERAQDAPLANVLPASRSDDSVPRSTGFEPAVFTDRGSEEPAAPAVLGISRESATRGPMSESADDPIVVDPSADWARVARQAYDARDFAVAAAYFGAEAKRNPEQAWTHYMLGLSSWKAGSTEEAAAAMRRSVEIDGDWIKAHINLSRIENDRGEFEAALAAAEAALAIDSDSPEASFLAARSLRNLARIDEAVAMLQHSLVLDPENGFARNLMGLIHVELKQDAEAVDQLRRAAELEPEVAFIQNNLGMALELHGKPVEALAAYRRAIEVDPAHGKAAANLARLEPTVPGDSQETEQAVAEDGSAPADNESDETEATVSVAEAAQS